MAGWRLRFGDLVLRDGAQIGSVGVNLYGLRRGRPVPVVSAVESMLRDGAIETTTSHGNRDSSILIGLDCDDPDATAEAEAILWRQSQVTFTELEWVGPRGGQPAVLRVLTADMEFVDDADWDLDEMRGRRVFSLSFRCAPFVYSDRSVPIMVPEPPAVVTTATISDASSATGWAYLSTDGATPVAPSVSAGGYVYGSLNLAPEEDGYRAARSSFTFTPSSPVALGSTPFVEVRWRSANLSGVNFYAGGLKLYADGVELAPVATMQYDSSFTSSFFRAPSITVSEFKIRPPAKYHVTYSPSPTAGDLRITHVERSNQPPAFGTARQQLASIPVQGAARAEGSLRIGHDTTALGNVFAYTFPDRGDGYSPSLRRFMTGGSPSTVAGTVSGIQSAWQAGGIATVPMSSLRPGPHLLMTRVRRTDAAGPLTLNATTSTGEVFAYAMTFGAASQWYVVSLGTVWIPDHDANTSLNWTLNLSLSGTPEPYVDDFWLFHMGEDTGLTRINLGTAAPSATGSSNYLWLDTATPDRPYPSIWRGTLPDRSDARPCAGDTASWGVVHDIVTPKTNLFVVATNAVPEIGGDYTPAWPFHPGLLK